MQKKAKAEAKRARRNKLKHGGDADQPAESPNVDPETAEDEQETANDQRETPEDERETREEAN